MYTKINERKNPKKRVAEKSRTYVRLKVLSHCAHLSGKS